MRRSAMLAVIASALIVGSSRSGWCKTPHSPSAPATPDTQVPYEYQDTRELASLVTDAARLVREKGEQAFGELRGAGSRWRHGEAYVFVLDTDGKMLVHPDPALEGRNQLDLTDVNGKPIIRGLIEAANRTHGQAVGWYHYEWPVPGGLLPRWKSTCVQAVTAPSGGQYIVGSGIYNDRMERAFVVDAVNAAVAEIERNGRDAFPRFYDRTGPFIAKDAYLFVYDNRGTALVHPAFPNLVGRNLSTWKDTQGKKVIQEALDLARTRGSGWMDYMWPKPGESISTQKSTYVRRAKLNGDWVVVGCGVYLAEAPKPHRITAKLTAPELQSLVRDAAQLLEQKGEYAYPEFRKKGSRWRHDDTYLIVWTLDGQRVFHGADASLEGRQASGEKDVLGRPYGQMFLQTVKSPAGEGWVHYMYPEPGSLFPTWKSAFVKRATLPSGQQCLVGCGIYNMQMDRVFIEDVVNRAATLVESQGKNAFSELRSNQGPFRFFDTYVFVTLPDGLELVNAGQPSVEGKNILNERDIRGKLLVRDYLDAALSRGSAWVEYHWYRPGTNTPVRKLSFVRKVQVGPDTYVVGSGYYPESEDQR